MDKWPFDYKISIQLEKGVQISEGGSHRGLQAWKPLCEIPKGLT